MGTAELACPSLQALLDFPAVRVRAVVTQPDRPKGRDLKLEPGHVKKLALSRGIPVLQPLKARAEPFIAELRQFAPDLIVVVAYGQILPQTILDIPRFGCLNVHTSILPKYRGAAPIQWAIFNGETETGVTIMKMDAGLDTGDIVSEARTPIDEADDAQTLHDRLARMGADLLLRTIPDYVAGRLTPRPQSAEGATYARKITKEDGRIDWSRSARQLCNQIRAFTPWPGAYTHYRRGEQLRMLKIWKAAVDAEPKRAEPGMVVEAAKTGIVVACGSGSLRIHEVQIEGSRRMPVEQFLAGHAITPGQSFAVL